MNEDDDDDTERGGEQASFQARLNAARERVGLDPKPPPPARNGGGDPSPLAVGLRVGIELASALIVGVAIGYGLDRLLGTKPVFIAVFVLLGGAAGVLNVWRIYAPKRR
jgi:ATP synthase protein I